MGRAFEFRKYRKFKRWANMSKTFTRIGKDIYIAVKEGGADPKNNSRLRALIQNAKSENMPKENIERAIKKATNKDTKDFKEVIYEGYAPGGVAVLIATATDNINRTVGNIRSHFNKVGGNLAVSGSVEFQFQHSCHFTLQIEEHDVEELELKLIDLNVEEIFEENDKIVIYASFEHYGIIQEGLELLDLNIQSSGFERIPNNLKKASKSDEALVLKLIDMLEDDDDVQNVFHNLDLSD